jgi:hypothetical protein
MTRSTRPAGAELSIALGLALQMGPVEGDGLTDEDLGAGWSFFGEEIMRYRRPVGWRPWGWWVFEQGEDPPSGTPRRSVWPSLAN